MRHVVAVTVVLLGLAGPTTATASPDPLAPGPLESSAVPYDAQVAVAPDEGTGLPAQPYRLKGVVHVPASGGPHPVIVLAHGAHELCRVGSTEVSAVGVAQTPCPVETPVGGDPPSHRGYDRLGRLLASHGYVVISVNSNGVMTFKPLLNDFADREQTLRLTLDLAAAWQAGARTVPDGVGALLRGRLDLDRVGVMGHSRGADAIGRLIAEPDRPAGIRAAIQIAGVDRLGPGQNPAPAGVHLATILGSCDADTGAGGAALWDRGRFGAGAAGFSRSLWLLMGANHAFFNSEWYDEWLPENQPLPLGPRAVNAACTSDAPTSRRLARDDQHRLGTAIMAAVFRRYVGGETAFDDLVRGRESIAAFACPAMPYGAGHPLPCDEVLRSAHLGPADERLVVLGEQGDLRAAAPVKAAACAPEAAAPCPEAAGENVARQTTVDWTGPGSATVELPGPADVRPFAALTFRVMMNPSDEGNDGVDALRFDLCVADAAGREACAPVDGRSPALRRAPAGDGTRYETADPARKGQRSLLLGDVRVGLEAFGGVDLGRVTAVRLRVGDRQATGSMQVADVAFQR